MSKESPPGVVEQILMVLASLKLTVVLLAMSIFIVLAGTLAQVDKGIWSVMDQYFRCWIAWVEIKIFAPRSRNLTGVFPFPGGWLIGAALVINLLVSHTLRIRVPARGKSLVWGVAILATGVAVTWYFIANVFDADSSEKVINPSWRVTVQLIEGTVAAGILFVGCKLLFQRKAGIVLLHAGVVLLMLSELFTGLFAEETMMTVYEGQTVNYAEDTREVELAVIDPSDEKVDDVIVVPEHYLTAGSLVKHDDLPFDLKVNKDRFMRNASLHPLKAGEENHATAGSGMNYHAHEVSEESGVDTSGGVDQPAAYVTVFKKGTDEEIATYLTAVALTANASPQKVEVDGKTWHVYMRFKRVYKPYAIYLYDFRFDRYPGTNTPKDYSSYVRLLDDERGTERDVRIWMNNPLRYRGDTLYQASFDQSEEGTVLQVVENPGWMVPYVGCMIVTVGLLGQFLLHLLGFLRKKRVLA